MTPISLKLEAFGPYSESETIDFTKLGENPLFLLHGPTGSGKSTILDGICYALFGETSSNERKAEEMRTSNAKDDKKTRVIFEFQIHKKKYRLERIPSYVVSKKNDKGTTKKNSDATLIEIGNLDPSSVIKKTERVTEKINEILGLTADQFRQVILLPQGKFRELLHASSKDREAIFSKLFQTDIYKDIENSLKERKSEYETKLSSSKERMRGLFSTTGVNNINELELKLSSTREHLSLLQNKKNDSEKLYENNRKGYEEGKLLFEKFESQKKKKLELDVLSNQKDIIEDYKLKLLRSDKAFVLQGDFKIIKSLSDEMKNLSEKNNHLQEKLKSLYPEKEKADENWKLAKQEYEKKGELIQKKNELESTISKILEIEKYEKEYSKIITELHKINLESENLNKEKYNSEKAIRELKDEEITLSRQLEKFPSLISEVQSLESEIKERSEYFESFTKIENLKIETKRFEEIIEDYQSKLEIKSESKKSLKYEITKKLASKLASELKQGEPCPVCGSNHHPNPQISHSNKENLELNLETLEAEIIILEKELVVQIHKKDTNNKQINEFEKNSINKYDQNIETLKNSFKEIQSIFENKKNEKAQIEVLFNRKKILSEKISQNDTNLRLTNDLIDKNRTQLFQLSREEGITSAKIDGLKNEIDFSKPIKNFEGELREIRNRLEKITINYETSEKKAKDLNNEYQRTESEVNQLIGILGGKKIDLESKNLDFIQKVKSQGFSNEEDFQNSLLEEIEKTNLQKKIQDYERNYSSVQGILSEYNVELKDKQVPNLDILLEEFKKSKRIIEEIQNEILQEEIMRSKLEGIQKEYHEIQKDNQQNETLYETFAHLSDVTGGTSGERINLQRFVLGVLLDDILEQASLRLKIMSRGRYTMVRKEDKSSGNVSSGLDLEIEDEYTGSRRNVQTLSGGESFLAALSLALGLSDVVQSYSGGIKLDTLFIDEGFGSLDPESLELAIRALYEIKDVGKMIGIISHVSELKEQIPLQIEVIPTTSGSRVKMKSMHRT